MPPPTTNKKRTGQPTQIEAQLYHSSSGQDPKAMGSDAGNDTGSKRERERTTEQARHPRPKPYSTKATQAKTQESHGEAAGNGAGDKRERERTRTDKNEQEATKPSREKGTKKQGPPKTE